MPALHTHSVLGRLSFAVAGTWTLLVDLVCCHWVTTFGRGHSSSLHLFTSLHPIHTHCSHTRHPCHLPLDQEAGTGILPELDILFGQGSGPSSLAQVRTGITAKIGKKTKSFSWTAGCTLKHGSTFSTGQYLLIRICRYLYSHTLPTYTLSTSTPYTPYIALCQSSVPCPSALPSWTTPPMALLE